MRALLLSGGEGSRLRPLTHADAKRPIPIAEQLVVGDQSLVEVY
jgi:dTDP-glucose pyrophosphorylase